MDKLILSLVSLVILLVALFVVLISTSINRYDSFQSHCVAAKGHIYKPDYISFCLTSDGRVIEVYP